MALQEGEIPFNLDKLFLGETAEQKDLLANAILSGGAQSFDDYKYMVGQYRGLTAAENRFKDLVDKWENR